MHDISDTIAELNQRIYGPRYCDNCKAIQPVIVHKLSGSDYTKLEGVILTIGFVGSYTCSICFKTINNLSESANEERKAPRTEEKL